jgi:outer membrane protein assembly factor BamC
MLRRLMVYLGASEQRATQAIAGQASKASKARLVQEGGETVLLIDEELRNAWRTTGLALDRVGFAVEDRDRSAGIYYVRYDDPSKGQEKKKGFLSKLAFWSSDKVDTVTQYQVKLTGEGQTTRVVVRDEGGQRDDSPTAQRILTLLSEQLR